ncbi:MAG: chorismate mutase [Bauldia sp.]|nr:chorismate mutase [Bauldia sp.]MCW5716521.1 chorismate mutase [Bauldia sp.]
MPTAAECQTKDEVRSEIDRIDAVLVALLAERFGFVRRMAELKRAPSDAYDEDRIEAVLGLVRREAEKHGLDVELAESLWRRLIEWNIAFEERSIGRIAEP